MDGEVAADSGLAALDTVLQFQGLPADPDQLRRRAAGQPFGPSEIVRCAREHNFRGTPCPLSCA